MKRGQRSKVKIAHAQDVAVSNCRRVGDNEDAAAGHSPDEVLAVAAESRLLEESSGELMISNLYDIFQSESAATFVPCRQAGTVVSVCRARPRVAAGVHFPPPGHRRRTGVVSDHAIAV